MYDLSALNVLELFIEKISEENVMVQASTPLQVKLCGKLNENDLSYDRVMASDKTATYEAPMPLSELARTSTAIINK